MEIPVHETAQHSWQGLLLLAALIAGALWILRPRYKFKIVVCPDDLKILGRIADSQRAKIEDFVLHDIALGKPFTVVGREDGDGSLRLLFRGNVDKGTQQRIRNFLLSVLHL